MKILHTSDWHIGKLVHNIHMTLDQKYILDQFIEWVKSNQPDVIIIAGDLYDRSIPPTEAVELLNDVLSDLILVEKIPVIAISGNHDSAERLGFAGGILEKQGLHMIHGFERLTEPIIINDAYGEVHFYPVPFMEPAKARLALSNEHVTDFESSYQAIMERINTVKNPDVRNVCITHAYVISGETVEYAESVRPLSIGGTEYVDVKYFEDFDYVALGHLHRPMKVKHDHIRYAGSLMKYSFSEALQGKSMTLVEMDKKTVKTENITFKPMRDLRIIKGKLSDLISKEIYEIENSEDYIMARLTDEEVLYEPMSSLRKVYPNVMKLEFDRSEYEHTPEGAASHDFRMKQPYELFHEFYEQVVGADVSQGADETLKQIIEDVMKEV